MNSLEKIQRAFMTIFNVELSDLNDKFTLENVENWDSVTQMTLVSALEEEFDIMLDIDDIYELNSYEKSLEILKKYDVEGV